MITLWWLRWRQRDDALMPSSFLAFPLHHSLSLSSHLFHSSISLCVEMRSSLVTGLPLYLMPCKKLGIYTIVWVIYLRAQINYAVDVCMYLCESMWIDMADAILFNKLHLRISILKRCTVLMSDNSIESQI